MVFPKSFSVEGKRIREIILTRSFSSSTCFTVRKDSNWVGGFVSIVGELSSFICLLR